MTVTEMGGRTREIRLDAAGRALPIALPRDLFGYAMVLLRLAMGWTLFQGGIVKVLEPGWTAAGYLGFAIPEGNPFAGLWANLAGNSVIDSLNAWGLTLTGLGLIVGGLVRWNAFWAAVMMLFYWASGLDGGLLQGLPLEHGWVVDDHIVYTFVLLALGTFGAGRILGADGYIEKFGFVIRNRWLRYLLG